MFIIDADNEDISIAEATCVLLNIYLDIAGLASSVGGMFFCLLPESLTVLLFFPSSYMQLAFFFFFLLMPGSKWLFRVCARVHVLFPRRRGGFRLAVFTCFSLQKTPVNVKPGFLFKLKYSSFA